MNQINRRLALEYAQELASSLFYFDREILGYEKMEEEVHLPMCEFIDERYKPEGQDDFRPFKMILLPRGGFKSSAVTVGYAIQQIVLNPNIRILIANENFNNSKRFASEIRGHLEKNELFRQTYGDFVGKKDWREDYFTVSKRTVNKKEPTISCAGIDVVKVGMHYDLIISDDLVSQNNITTKEQMDKVIDFYRLALSLLEPDGKFILIGTRWHFNDLYNHVLENEGHKFNFLIQGAYNKDGSLWFPQRLTKEFLDDQKKSQGSYIFACTPAEAPVLMADMTQKKISEVEVGDTVVGWDVAESGRRKLTKSKVLGTNSRIADVVKIKLNSGKTIRCTPDHNWYTGRLDESHREYKPAQIGGYLLDVLDDLAIQTDEEKFLSAWLGGMFDGEGGCSKNSSAIYIHQSRKNNPEVCEAIEETLGKLNYDYGISYREDKDTHAYYIKGGFNERIRFVNECKPIKKENIIRTIFSRGSRFVKFRDKVVSITQDGREMVYALTTETGNYISQNYASKNCQYLNNPVDDESAVFKKSWIRYYNQKEGICYPEDYDDNREYYGPDNMHTFLTIDPAISKAKGSDNTGMTVVGVDPQLRKFVLHAKKYKLDPSELINEAFRLWEKYGTIEVGIETAVFQMMLKYAFLDEMRERKKYLPLKELRVSNRTSKEMRIRSLQPEFEAGMIYIRSDMVDLEDELLRFPVGQNDDIIDSLAHQTGLWFAPSMSKKEEAPVGSFDWVRDKIIKANKRPEYIGRENQDRWRLNDGWY